MRIAISSGHSRHVSGAVGLVNEVEEARKVTDAIAAELRLAGVEVAVFHDDASKTQAANLSAIVAFHNAQWRDRDYDVSVHFNSSAGGTTQSAIGTEVCHLTQPVMAARVSAAIAAASGLKDRGAKKRTDLGFLNRTNRPALLLEILFVNSAADVAIYRRPEMFDAICKAIAEALSGKTISVGPPSSTPAPAMPILRRGDKGDAVGELQQLLNEKANAGLRADKDLGPLTEAALWSFVWSRLKP